LSKVVRNQSLPGGWRIPRKRVNSVLVPKARARGGGSNIPGDMETKKVRKKKGIGDSFFTVKGRKHKARIGMTLGWLMKTGGKIGNPKLEIHTMREGVGCGQRF